jgi:predicted protein tyrosine phosphatase
MRATSKNIMKPKRINVLFVCSRNQWRSPTAEKIYENDDRVNARSRGTTRSAVKTITASDLAWADVVMAMEEKHRRRILADFPGGSRFKAVHVLDIPDDFRFMELDLVNLINTAADPIIDELWQQG